MQDKPTSHDETGRLYGVAATSAGRIPDPCLPIAGGAYWASGPKSAPLLMTAWGSRRPDRVASCNAPQLAFKLLVIAEMRSHETLPQSPMIGRVEVKQFMSDDVVLEFPSERQQRGIKSQPTSR